MRPHVQPQLPCYLSSLHPPSSTPPQAFKYAIPTGGVSEPGQCLTRDTMDLTGAHTAITATLLPLLLLLLLCSSGGDAQQPAGAVREYYVAAVEIGWDYIYLDDADPASEER